jgi:DNA-binding transcriptional LysR family regulator
MSSLANVELRELRIFLALADELHFGRAAERLGVSQPTVSEAVRLLERRVGTRLFERTSRRVTLTPAGTDLRRALAPNIEGLDRALGGVRDSAAGVSGTLRIVTTVTTRLPPVIHLCRAFRARYPECAVQIDSAIIHDPFVPLRRGLADVLVNWVSIDEPDLTVGPVIAAYDRVLAVARGHRLAGRESVSVEDMADELVCVMPPSFPESMAEAFMPLHAPSGRPIRRVRVQRADDTWSFGAAMAAVGRGEIVHPTVRFHNVLAMEDVALVPIRDMPPLPLGLIWRSAAEDAKVRALAEVARVEGPWPADIS